MRNRKMKKSNRAVKDCSCCKERASYDEFETEEQAFQSPSSKMIDTGDEYEEDF